MKRFGVRYGVSFVACLAALLLTQGTFPLIRKDAFDFFQGAVVVAAWYGGLGPGLLAAALSIFALDFFLLPPINAFALTGEDLLRLLIFGSVAVLSSMLSAKLKKAKNDLQRAHDLLETRIEGRTAELSMVNAKLTLEMTQRSEAENAIMEISNREQRRLGQDLHDGLSQILAGVKLMAERVKTEVQPLSAPAASKVAVIESGLSEALSSVDTFSRGLYPVELESNGLMAAMAEFAVKISKMFAIDCRFKCWRPVTFHSAVANHLYRIAQEAVMNAIKGGKATRINVRIFFRGDRAVLSVADNGVGFGKGEVRKGMGLKLVEYRARVINGTIKFRSRVHGSTLMSCSFPI